MEENKVVMLIDNAIIDKRSIKIGVNNQEIELYPHLLINVDAVLTLIGEDLKNKVLLNIVISDITSLKHSRKKYKANFVRPQLEEYVKELRNMNGKEDRLILKIRAGEHLEINPPHQLLLNTYVVKTPNMDLIWAATIEMTPDLMDWFYQIKDKVEIIAPESFKNDFLMYMEKKFSHISVSKFYHKVS